MKNCRYCGKRKDNREFSRYDSSDIKNDCDECLEKNLKKKSEKIKNNKKIKSQKK